MQAFFVAGADGLEIDRCQFCGGIWLDGGELEQMLGHAVEVELLEGTTRRRCVSCAVSLDPVELHGVSAERCALCHSLYFDDGELESLATGPVRLQAATAAPTAEQITFRCQGCGGSGDIADSHATVHGLACSLCVSMLDATPSILPAVRAGRGVAQEYYGPMNERYDLAQIISGVLGLFR